MAPLLMAALPRRSKFRAVAAAVLGIAVVLVMRQSTSSAAAMPLAHPRTLLAIKSPVLLQVKSFCKKVCVKWEKCPPLSEPQPKGCVIGEPPHAKFLKSRCVKYKTVCNPPATTHPPYDGPRITPDAAREGLLNRKPAPTPEGPPPIGTPKAPPPAGMR